MIRIRFFGPGEFIQNGFSDEQYVFDIESICIHGKEDSENVRTVKNAGENLTLKQMFEISEQLKLEQNEISWSVSNQLGNFSMETIISG